jgi:poly-gamma-glutamate synthase PgsB/CapB
MSDVVGVWREKLAGRELAEAQRLAGEHGVGAVVARAAELLSEAETLTAMFDDLTRAIEQSPHARTELVTRFVRQTSPAETLKDDLRALKGGDPRLLGVAALGERVLRWRTDREIACESMLVVARTTLNAVTVHGIGVDVVQRLAEANGRWSRRVEALALLRAMGRYSIAAGPRAAIARLAARLAQRSEHRWVQSAALETLAAFEPAAAHALAAERIVRPADGDDFLVRERILDVAGRLRAGAHSIWDDLITHAHADPSEHVRMTAARLERDETVAARIARTAKSPRVRATAILASTSTEVVTSGLADGDALVVRTAAEQVVAMASAKKLRQPETVIAALSAAAARSDLPAAVQVAIKNALAEISVRVDPYLGMVHEVLGNLVRQTPVGGGMKVSGAALGALSEQRLGRVLATLAQDDHPLGADRDGAGITLYRGDVRGFAAWRVLFELCNPAPSKRQGFVHTWGRSPRGALRAPPGGLAELTATRVPGERVLIPGAGDWGRQVPLVDDLLATGVLFAKPAVIVGHSGTTFVQPGSTLLRRALDWLTLTRRYAEIAELRRRALDSDEPSRKSEYVDAVHRLTGISLTYRAHESALTAVRSSDVTRRLPALEASLSFMPLAALGSMASLGRDFLEYTTSLSDNRLPDVAAYAAIVLSWMLVRAVMVKRSIDDDRKHIPLVLGGWGTRGKSGTERLKAGLLQGMGYECLVKTTGCEAMFIHAMPGAQAREVFIHRPYDKATVWEQRDVLRLARRFGVRAFLWECMALKPDLVNLLQHQWMKDDYSTITNAYPDHEDVQGPTGYDVAEVIGEFVPTRGRLFTAEDQMLPLLRERARERGTSVDVVSSRDADLIAEDLLARFPYSEHPRNVALVASLAEAMGIPKSIAIAEMADHVVPDLGVLKTYPTARHAGRSLSFTNGMSANERTGAISNWRRSGFDAHDLDREPGRWLVTVVNNRADRIARSEVFARFIVEDAAAHRHVLIGTNVSGLLGFIEGALTRHLRAISPTHQLTGSGDERLATAQKRVSRAFRALSVGRTDAVSAAAELKLFGAPLDAARLEPLLMPAAFDETYEAARAAVRVGLSHLDAELLPFAVERLARRRTLRAVRAALETHLFSDPAKVEAVFVRAYRDMFSEQLVPLHDPEMTGDAIIDAVARAVPPNVHAAIMGLQNIKGTGLDFVYRWVNLETVERSVKKLGSSVPSERADALRELAQQDDHGLLGASRALEAVRAAAHSDHERLPYRATLETLERALRDCQLGLGQKRSVGLGERVRRAVRKTFDYLGSIGRQRDAGQVLDQLVAGRLSHAAAATEMRDILSRAKKF